MPIYRQTFYQKKKDNQRFDYRINLSISCKNVFQYILHGYDYIIYCCSFTMSLIEIIMLIKVRINKIIINHNESCQIGTCNTLLGGQVL